MCFGSGQSLPQSVTSVTPARRFKKRFIASVRLFTQPGPLGDIATHPRYRFTSSILFVLDVEGCISSLSYPMPHPPTGTVSFVFTDIEGSVTLWERHPDAMRLALARHNAVLREVIGAHSGFIFKTVGDAFCAAFATASDALAAATDAILRAPKLAAPGSFARWASRPVLALLPQKSTPSCACLGC